MSQTLGTSVDLNLPRRAWSPLKGKQKRTMNFQYSLLQEEKNIFHIFKYKYYFILFVIMAATCMLLVINIERDVFFESHEAHLSWDRLHNLVNTDNGYFVKTEGCSIPSFDAFDPSILKYIEKVDPIICYNASNPPLITSNDTSFWIIRKNLYNYGVYNKTNLSCCYKGFYRTDPEDPKFDGDSAFQYSTSCIKFNETEIVNVETNFIEIECSYKNAIIYKDYHSFVISMNDTSFRIKNAKLKKHFNILILGLDAVSRLNLHRTMPRTLEYLQNLNVVEFKGYNKVGDNTYPNLIPLLSGFSEEELRIVCLPSIKSIFDKCPFIWQNYHKAGYYTAFAEDAASISLFNYVKSGFRKQPTDYYWRTFDHLAEISIGHEKQANAKLCLGPRLTLDVLLSYVKKFTRAMINKRYFGFFWETSISHDMLNYPSLGDIKYYNLLKTLHTGGHLNRTVLVLVSDHGIRWGGIRSTHQGRMEERLPFLFVVLPEAFKKTFPLASSNLRQNTIRLTTPFDLHETLLDLTNLRKIQDKKIRKTVKLNSYYNRGISLFLPINENRTCATAGIAPHWCTCHETRKLDIEDKVVTEVAKSVVDHLNTLLENYAQCAKLYLRRIIDATVGEPSKSINMDSVKHIIQDYTVVVRTTPGNGLFEATLRNGSSGWNITGTVSRINLYGKQSECVDNFHIKLYCFCYNPFTRN